MLSSNEPVLFVVGAGRSGTTLLASLVGSHSEVGLIPETGILRRRILGPRQSSRSEIIADTAAERWRQIGIEAEHAIAAADTPLELFAIIAKAARGDGSWSLEKDPRLVEHVESILEMFPKSRILQIYRDPVDVVASRLSADWSSEAGFIPTVLRTAVSQEVTRLTQKTAASGRVLSISYDHLVDETDACTSTILEFLELNDEDLAGNRKKSAQRLVAKDELQWKARVLEPISSRAGTGKKELSGAQQFLIHAFCGGSYSTEPISVASKLLHIPSRLFVRAAAKIVLRQSRQDEAADWVD